MEHLDSLAGSIAYKHVLGPGNNMFGNVRDRGFFLVTAAVDRCATSLYSGLFVVTKSVLTSLEIGHAQAIDIWRY